MFKEIIEETNKDIQKKLLFEGIDATNFKEFMYFLEHNHSPLLPFFNHVNESLIDLCVDKEPLIFNISDDNIINIVGESGSGKSTYAVNNYSKDTYQIVETDKLFNDKMNDDSFINHLRAIIYDKYSEEVIPGESNLPINFRHFNDVYEIILNESVNINKGLVIDSGQIRHLKRFDLLKGKIIFIRTSVNESIRRAIVRFDTKYPNATKEQKEAHLIRKYTAYELYKKINSVMIKCFILYEF